MGLKQEDQEMRRSDCRMDSKQNQNLSHTSFVPQSDTRHSALTFWIWTAGSKDVPDTHKKQSASVFVLRELAALSDKFRIWIFRLL